MTRHITSSSSQLVQWAPFLNVTRDLASLHSHVASRPSDLKLAGRSDGGNREFLKFLNFAAPIYPIFSPRQTATPHGTAPRRAHRQAPRTVGGGLFAN